MNTAQILPDLRRISCEGSLREYALHPLAARDGLEWLEITPKKIDESSYQKRF
ncbi:hypothetical protein [Candidatus Glomeribacter gigasporarum]|uniref:hypothetical protein n=1 Tax=Candidatus Glomeribacter gigasporarum TaxID=132144 RepID=UPI0002F9E48C|nr:hypothetical protein [Candidatus Glomeribacter gigasporarum]